jgi:PTH1 family peptidyl-tRNA hydrolase
VKLVAGLGNPGERYRRTRHNVGFDVIERLTARHDARLETAPADALQARWQAGAEIVWLIEPRTFMNLSGAAVAALVRYYKVETTVLLVVCDDVNLPLGRLRARGGGSDGGHNGLRSIAQVLGTTAYPRLRVGVGRGDLRRDLADHVLGGFDAAERPVIEEATARAAEAVERWVTDGLERMMCVYHREDASGQAGAPADPDGEGDRR